MLPRRSNALIIQCHVVFATAERNFPHSHSSPRKMTRPGDKTVYPKPFRIFLAHSTKFIARSDRSDFILVIATARVPRIVSKETPVRGGNILGLWI
jgi:hypothetical protein